MDMKGTSNTISSDELSQLVIAGIQEKKGSDIVLIDLKNINAAVADYFVICTGNSDTQLDAISDEVQRHVEKEADDFPRHVEGRQSREWILMDYVDVVVHIFKNDKREFYGLESLWGDAKAIRIEDMENTSGDKA